MPMTQEVDALPKLQSTASSQRRDSVESSSSRESSSSKANAALYIIFFLSLFLNLAHSVTVGLTRLQVPQLSSRDRAQLVTELQEALAQQQAAQVPSTAQFIHNHMQRTRINGL
jgi:hypothetical protein